MGELTFRMYRPEDEQAVFDLWEDFIAPAKLPKRRELFRWLVAGNPYLGDRSPYHVVLAGEKLVAHYGNMPVRFLVDGQPVEASICHDIYVQRRHRGKQAAVSDRLVKSLEERSENFILALWFAPFNYGLHRRCGWLDVKTCHSMVRLYDIGAFLPARLKHRGLRALVRVLGNALLRLADARTWFQPASGVRIREIESFDERFDSFAREVAADYGVIVERGAKYLNWKYVGRPYIRYTKLAAEENGQLLGYIVFRVDHSEDDPKGIILDILTSVGRPDVYRSLVLDALRRLRSQGVAYVACVNTCPTFDRVLRRCGFLRSRRSNPVMVANWSKHFSEDYARNIENWYITRGDGDGDFWTIDETVAAENQQ